MHERHKVKVSKWKEALKDAAVGPLIVAPEVVEMAADWDPKENDDWSFSKTLEWALGDGKNFRFFQLRNAAVAAMGGMRDARMFDHQAAVWITGKAQNGKLTEALRVCGAAYNCNHKVPLTTSQVKRACRELLGARPKTRIDATALLLAEIERLKTEIAMRDEEIERLLNKGSEVGMRRVLGE